MATPEPRRLVLASGSATRRALLANAGIEIEVSAADVDEAAIRDSILAESPNIDRRKISEALAVAKAEAVSRQQPDALVIGADQILTLDTRVFEKPRSIDDARDHLRALRGRTHHLLSSTAIAEAGRILWLDTQSAALTLRAFSEDALDAYLAKAGDDVLWSVGAYQIEGSALQLFDAIDGDYTTILGLPMMPLLAELRRLGALLS